MIKTKRLKHPHSRDPEPIRSLTVITKLELGGAQQVALNTLRGLDPGRYRKYLIAGAGGLLDEEAKRLSGVEVHLWKSFKHPIRVWHDFLTCLRLVWFMRQNRIGLVHTHSSKAGLLGRLAARLSGVPVVLHTIHGWPFHDYQSSLVRSIYVALEKWAARFSTRLIAVSQATQDKGLKFGIGQPGQYRVVYPASDLDAFAPGTRKDRLQVRKEFGFPGPSPLVGMVACLKPQKAPVDFVRAANVVLNAVPEARFLLVGDGSERQAVESEIRRLGLENKFTLAGWREDVPRLMQAMDILALSSLWEGLPCVLAQAMASSVPIVATDVEGTREAIESGKNGFLVPPRDPQALGKALIRLLQKPAERKKMGQQGKKLARKFHLAHMLETLDQIYQEAWQEHQRQPGNSADQT